MTSRASGRGRIRWNRWLGPPTALLALLALAAPASAQNVDPGQLGSMYRSLEAIGAGEMWNDGYRGAGVDVAVIDTGVTPVNGLRTPGKVIHGPDLSWESQSPGARHLDSYGHGTHMAGIIAGRGDGVPATVQQGEERFTGVAPGSRIVSLKAADSNGATDVSQVIAAIDWVVKNRDKHGLRIRVLNLSYGTDSVQPSQVDPLSHAVENAWRKGIVVVVSAGNGGFGDGRLNNPAINPYVIAVGAASPNGTYGSHDDVIQPWSEHGVGRTPDVVAPGKSIISLRDPGSTIDETYPEGRYGEDFFRGSGTSQAAAFVSGATALIISQRRSIAPDQVKALLERTASPLPQADPEAQGAGMIDLKVARDTPTPQEVTQTGPRSTGLGLLDEARGSMRLVAEGVTLDGERDIFGAPFSSARWAPASAGGNAWHEERWMDAPWSGRGFEAVSWSGGSYESWRTSPWTRSSWRGDSWSGEFWQRSSWRDGGWTRSSWRDDGWSRSSWRSNDLWSSVAWGSAP
jgi:serine protease AprX